MRRAPQLGQKPRHLQLKATSFSARQGEELKVGRIAKLWNTKTAASH